MTPIIVAIAVYAFLAIVCAEIFSAAGRKNPHTTNDSWTGDSTVDAVSVIFWPVSILISVAALLGRWIAERIVQ